MTKFYEIIRLCKEDILMAFNGRDDLNEIEKFVKNLKSSEMRYIAEKVGNDLLEQGFWDSLRETVDSMRKRSKGDD